MVNFLKGGLFHATKLTAVSPTYAKEIQTPDFGHGLDPVARFRAADLIGVLNGIDVDHWGPEVDEFIPAHYNPQNFQGKALCKKVLQGRVGIEEDPQKLLFAAVARMDPQKGLDLLAQVIPRVLESMHAQIIVLGMGEQELEHWFLDLSYRYPGRLGVHIGYDNALAHLVEAGSDVFLMPSRFEPCGLNQMYSMRYGTPPIVRATGGLLDTVEPYQEGTSKGTGFVFEEASADALYYTMGWACSTYYDRPQDFRALQINGMKKDFSWKHSAQEYEDVYRWAVAAKS
jgi:starch synthase